MNNSDFVTVFSSSSYVAWWFPTFLGVGGVLLGAVLFLVEHWVSPLLLKSMRLKSPTQFKPLILGFAGVFFLVGSGTLLMTFGNFAWEFYVLSSGKAAYVEGIVQNFVPMPFQGHANESFTVNEVPFSYSDYQITGGFNNSSSHGGPVRAGMHVRIWYAGNRILKLEIEKDNLQK